MGNLPTRKGPPIGRASERQMMSETDLGGFRKRYRTNPDGSVTMLKTRAGWPQFTTTEQDVPVGRPVGGWVFQATTSTAEVWDDGSYLSKTTPLALSGNDKSFVGNTNWFSATNPAQTLSFPFVQIEYGGSRRLLTYTPTREGGVWENGEKILDLTTFDHPDYEAYASVVCAGAVEGVPQAVLRVRYYPTTTSDFILVRKNEASTFAGLVGWESAGSASVPWDEPIFYQQPTMNASGTAFSAVVLNLVDSTNPSKSAWRYQLLVRTWALPSFSVTDSHSATRRDFVASAPFNPGIETYETLPGGVSYLKERKATESYFDERVVEEYETDVPQFAGYNGDQLVVTRRIARFKDVYYYNQLRGIEGKFSDEWVVKSFPLGTTYEDNLAIMQGLVFDGGHTLSPSAAESHARAATFGSSTPPVIADVMGDIQFGVNSNYTYYYWREGYGGVSYSPHAKFNPYILSLATRLANSFRRTKLRLGFAENSSKTFLYKYDNEIFGNEAGGVVRSITGRYDRVPSLGAVSYIVPHPLGSGRPSITVTVTRLTTGFVNLGMLTQVLEASPEVADTDDHGELIHCDPRAALYVRWNDGVIAEFQVPSTGIGDIGELANLGTASAMTSTIMEARAQHPSERIGAVAVHPGKLRAAILTIDNPDYSLSTPPETSLRHAAGGSVTTVTPPDGKLFVTAVYFRK